MWTSHRISICLALASLLLGGCVLAPKEAKREKAAMQRAGQRYEKPFNHRSLPELPTQPTWREVLHRAFMANGDLESAFFRWAAAVHRIDQAGGWPNTAFSTSFSYMLSPGNMKSFDRLTVSVGPDPMENLAFPLKPYQAAKVAHKEARAAGKRFVAAKFELQRKVLNAWLEYSLLAEKARIQRENLALLKQVNDTAAARVRAGAAQQDLLRVEIEYRMAENDLRDLEARLPQARAMLNAMMAREPDASLEPPRELPDARPIDADDSTLLAVAAENNPELAGLAHQVQGRKDALTLAKLQYIPDFNPFAGFTGTISQFVGFSVSIPSFLAEVRAKVKESRADLGEMMAMYRQTRFDRGASTVAALYALRNSERQASLYQDQIMPTADRVLTLSRRAYSAGTGTYLDMIDAQRTLLEVRLGLAEARIAREQSLADLEALIGVDVESLGPEASHE